MRIPRNLASCLVALCDTHRTQIIIITSWITATAGQRPPPTRNLHLPVASNFYNAAIPSVLYLLIMLNIHVPCTNIPN